MTHKETTIGVLGLGSRSTRYYIELLNAEYQKRKGGYSTCPFTLLNANFDHYNPFLPDQFEHLEIQLKSDLLRLEQLEINHLLIPNITLHQTFDRLQLCCSIAHPVKLAIQKVQASNNTTIMLFGSRYTMESSYIKDLFLEHGIVVLEPSEIEKGKIDQFRKLVYEGKETEKERSDFFLLQNELSKQNPVIIACTELSLFAADQVIDMARLQVEDVVSRLTLHF